MKGGRGAEVAAGARADVVLALMPYAMMRFPSLGLSLLKAGLLARGISCRVDYANIRFDDELGHDLFATLTVIPAESQLAEWTFAEAAFPEFRPDVEEHFARYAHVFRWASYKRFLSSDEGFRERLLGARRAATQFVDRLARGLVAEGVKVLGCGSNYQQHVASLALLRRVKELDPRVTTVLGGVNCSGDQGRVTHRSFPWVDVTFCAAADESFPRFCQELLEGKPLDEVVERLGPDVLGPADRRSPRPRRGGPPAPMNLDTTPVPDFDDYFAAVAASRHAGGVMTALPVEGSRGCWWGNKTHCSFCGINAEVPFHSKSGPRLLSEMESLSERYGIRSFALSDQIFDLRYLKTLFPLLAQRGRELQTFFQCKSNLKREEVSLLARAGVRWLQIGIESLDDRGLVALKKGATVAQNLQALRWCLEHGIMAGWNLLVGYPDEDDSWNLELAKWLPCVFHLQPPGAVLQVMFYRYSPYQRRAEEYGVRLVPARGYRSVYPLGEGELEELAYFFEVAEGDRPPLPGQLELTRVVHNWRIAFDGPRRPILRMRERGDALVIEDTRPVATAAEHLLKGAAAELYRRCDRAQAAPRLLQELERELGAPMAELEACVARLLRDRLLLEVSGRLVALAVPPEVYPLPADEEAPHGFVRSSR